MLKSKVHYASWSETCSLARASEQVSDRFDGVCDKLTTFSGQKTCLGQDSTITTCRDSASRFVTGSLCFCRASQMDFRKRPDVRRVRHFFDTVFYLFCVMTLCVRHRLRQFPCYKIVIVIIIFIYFIIVCIWWLHLWPTLTRGRCTLLVLLFL